MVLLQVVDTEHAHQRSWRGQQLCKLAVQLAWCTALEVVLALTVLSELNEVLTRLADHVDSAEARRNSVSALTDVVSGSMLTMGAVLVVTMLLPVQFMRVWSATDAMEQSNRLASAMAAQAAVLCGTMLVRHRVVDGVLLVAGAMLPFVQSVRCPCQVTLRCTPIR